MRAIEPLPASTRSRLRSTQLLTSLSQIVSELVQNALDAHATTVDVGLDCDGWSCWVRDNGAGILKADLSSMGTERYRTSKTYSPSALGELSTFGFRGEALASAADISCLEISSRPSESKQSECWSVIVKGGEQLHNGRALRWKLPDAQSGTVVSVRDAFYNLPVRRHSHPSPTRTLELVRREIESYALASPHVSFSLENTAPAGAPSSSKSAGKVLVIPKTMSPLGTFRRIYGRALAENVEEINVGAEGLRLKGFISLDGAPSKSHQFMFVNNHPVSSSELSKTVDTTFAHSTFAKHAYEESGKFTPEKPHQRRSPRKQEKHPVYVLNLTMPSTAFDNCLEPSKSVMSFKDHNKLTEFLACAVRAFLERNGFRPAKPRAKRRHEEEDAEFNDGSPRKKPRLVTSDATPSRPASSSTSTLMFISPSPTTATLVPRPSTRQSNVSNDEIGWRDPATGRMHILDKRTGNTISREDDETSTAAASRGQRSIVDTRSLRTHGKGDAPTPMWIEDVFAGWENPTFRPSAIERCVSTTVQTTSCITGHTHRHSCSAHQSDLVSTAPTSFSRDDLRSATVLGQVDRKFVACILSETLVLVDQHAADERIRVERFLRQLCEDGADLQLLEEPVPVLLTKREATLLATNQRFRDAFARWGVRVEANIGDDDDDTWQEQRTEQSYVQVWVHSVPQVIADKLLQDNELRDFLKSYLAVLETEGAPPRIPEEAPWSSILQYYPKALLDLANSKACRGAIMFNDPLDLDRCKRLISELAETMFPFQCAHGRPSLAPLTSINALQQPVRRKVDWDAFASLEEIE
ncbi:hypothetical protein EXIGLDRAFT_737842 [Exidia glandulosa HHB12029]|uniref:MutL C-terminal dimerisation domain-containing protein n=1 Tax=Exidia glandulosa HHB12029 TaxID=1314781 RepID=A0A165QX24_EXIGL|nr:hypothetical protein EXIGLDRAFT_737842 [Exidia glandulosa HHB12029]